MGGNALTRGPLAGGTSGGRLSFHFAPNHDPARLPETAGCRRFYRKFRDSTYSHLKAQRHAGQEERGPSAPVRLQKALLFPEGRNKRGNHCVRMGEARGHKQGTDHLVPLARVPSELCPVDRGTAALADVCAALGLGRLPVPRASGVTSEAWAIRLRWASSAYPRLPSAPPSENVEHGTEQGGSCLVEVFTVTRGRGPGRGSAAAQALPG